MLTILLRFVAGAILGWMLVLWLGVPGIIGVLILSATGTIAAVWGDDFLLWLLRVYRYLK